MVIVFSEERMGVWSLGQPGLYISEGRAVGSLWRFCKVSWPSFSRQKLSQLIFREGSPGLQASCLQQDPAASRVASLSCRASVSVTREFQRPVNWVLYTDPCPCSLRTWFLLQSHHPSKSRNANGVWLQRLEDKNWWRKAGNVLGGDGVGRGRRKGTHI